MVADAAPAECRVRSRGNVCRGLSAHLFSSYVRFCLTAFSRPVDQAWLRRQEYPSDRLSGRSLRAGGPIGQNRRALEAACEQARGQGGPGLDPGADGATEEAAGELEPSFAQRQADALGVVAESALAGGLDRGTAGDRYQVVVHVDADALRNASDVPAGTSAAAHAAPGRPASSPQKLAETPGRAGERRRRRR